MISPPPLPRQNHRAGDSNFDLTDKLIAEIYRDRRRERLFKCLRLLLILGFWWWLFSHLFAASQARKNIVLPAGEHTAVIRLSGEISAEEDNADKLLRGLREAYDTPDAKGIIIHADSPGGSPVISDVAFNEIRRLKSLHRDKPLYFVVGDVCASGCYYIAVAGDRIYANPSSLVGSIGVISGGFGATELLQKIGVERRLKTAGRNKGMGDPFSPETPEQQAIWQGMLDDVHAQFIGAVRAGRPALANLDPNDDVFSGRVYTGSEAQKNGLIDGLGSVYSVARDEIGAEKLIDYTPKEELSEALSKKFGVNALHREVRRLTQEIWY